MTTMQAHTRARMSWRLMVATGATMGAVLVAALVGVRHERQTPQAAQPVTIAERGRAATVATGARTASRLVIYITASDEAAAALRSLLAQPMYPAEFGAPVSPLVLVAGSVEAEHLDRLPLPSGTHIIDTRGDATAADSRQGTAAPPERHTLVVC